MQTVGLRSNTKQQVGAGKLKKGKNLSMLHRDYLKPKKRNNQ
jgi:hypothetical protein